EGRGGGAEGKGEKEGAVEGEEERTVLCTYHFTLLCLSSLIYKMGMKTVSLTLDNLIPLYLPQHLEQCSARSNRLTNTNIINVINVSSFVFSSCETCGSEEAKYRCPRCLKCSCSLACVKKHKTDLVCSGIRDKTAFVSKKEFTDMNLLSDYRFLEDAGRSADCAARDIFLRRPSTHKFLNYMKNRARRLNIDLKILPVGFTKRRENSTMFNKKEQRFYWHLKLLFPQSNAEYTEKRVPEDKTLHEILRTYIDPEKSDPVIRQRLKAYTLSQADIQILMKIENMQQNLVRYCELDSSKSLLDNLKNKVVIEYPTLHVVLKGSKNDMVVLGQGKYEFSSCYSLGEYNITM
uniref:Box C/D snoRNA protein 1 n=1 Tax=Ornithorhynchus anatinus TaxID=9258 RepID=K7EGA2_ORNAN